MTDVTLKALLFGEDRGMGRALHGVGSAAEGAGEHMHHFGEFARRAFAAFAVVEGVRKGVEFLKSSTEAAIDDEAAQRKLAVALKNTTGATKDDIEGSKTWIDQAATKYGLSVDDLYPAYQRLAESSGSVTKAQKEMGVAFNVTAGTGKNLATVSTALMKANNGTMASLSRLGLKTKDAQGNTLSLKDALSTMASTFKGQAEARVDSFQGKMDRLNAIIHEGKVKIGDELIPVLSSLADWVINSVIPAVAAASSWLHDKLSPHVDDASTVLHAKLVPAIQAVVQWFESNLLPVIQDVAKWIKNELIPTVIRMYADVFPSLVKAVKDVGSHLSKLGPFITLVEAALKGLWSITKSVLIPVIEWLAKHTIPLVAKQLDAWIDALAAVGKMGIWLWNNALEPAFKAIANGIAFVLDMIAKMFDGLSHIPGKIGDKFASAATALHNAADGARDLAGALKKIPTRLDIDIVYHHMGRPGDDDPDLGGAAAPRTSSRRSSSTASPKATAAVENHYTINVHGALDANATAKQIDDILTRRRRLSGNAPLGFQTT